MWLISPPQFSLQEFKHLETYERSLRPLPGFPPRPPVVTLPIRVKQEEEGGNSGGQLPAGRDLPTGLPSVIKVEPVEVEAAPGVSNTFSMVSPILRPGTLPVYSTVPHLLTPLFPFPFQALVGEIALISPSIFQDLRPDTSLLAPGDQPEEVPPQSVAPEEEPARDPEVPSLPPGSLETVVGTLYSCTVQCDLTYCLPILLRRPPPQNCVLHCRHPSLRTT